MDHEEDIPEPSFEDLVHIDSFADVNHAQDYALVVLAMGLPCWILQQPNGFSLHSLPENASAIHSELQTYQDEQDSLIAREQAPLPIPNHPSGWGLYCLWAAALCTIFILQQRLPDLTSHGSSSNIEIIDHHEWWRPFTALFLHSDSSHLLGNLLSGLFFMLLVCRSIGPTKGWITTLACGAIGNTATAISNYPSPFASIGASTAVFAALGILSGLGLILMLHHRLQLPWLRIISPLIGGIIILGMVGAGQPGDNTDVLGHVYGFCTGIVCGFLIGMQQQRKSGIQRVTES